MKKTNFITALGLVASIVLTGCFGGRMSSLGRGGEVVGVSGKSFTEPTPYGMTLVKRGFLKWGLRRTIACGDGRHPIRKYQSKASGWTRPK